MKRKETFVGKKIFSAFDEQKSLLFFRLFYISEMNKKVYENLREKTSNQVRLFLCADIFEI